MVDHSAKPEMLFTDNNHWRFGWGEGLYNFKDQGEGAAFWARFGPCTRQPKLFDAEIAVAARKIADSTSKPIYLHMLGGIESEAMARVMLQERIPFKPVTLKYENDYNAKDLAFVFDFCRQYKLEPEIIDLDVVSFMQNCINTPYPVGTCAHLAHMHVMRHIARIGGFTVFGGGDQRFKVLEPDQMKIFPVMAARIAIFNFMQTEQIEAAPAFFSHTPELMLSFLQEAFQHGFDDLTPFGHNIKKHIYQKYWPDLKERPLASGFEAVGHIRKTVDEALVAKFKSKLFFYGIPVRNLEKQLTHGLYTLESKL